MRCLLLLGDSTFRKVPKLMILRKLSGYESTKSCRQFCHHYVGKRRGKHKARLILVAALQTADVYRPFEFPPRLMHAARPVSRARGGIPPERSEDSLFSRWLIGTNSRDPSTPPCFAQDFACGLRLRSRPQNGSTFANARPSQ